METIDLSSHMNDISRDGEISFINDPKRDLPQRWFHTREAIDGAPPVN
jgi:hypothetical protein